MDKLLKKIQLGLLNVGGFAIVSRGKFYRFDCHYLASCEVEGLVDWKTYIYWLVVLVRTAGGEGGKLTFGAAPLSNFLSELVSEVVLGSELESGGALFGVHFRGGGGGGGG